MGRVAHMTLKDVGSKVSGGCSGVIDLLVSFLVTYFDVFVYAT